MREEDEIYSLLTLMANNPITYLLRVEFTTGASAPVTSYAGENGTLTGADPASQISVSGGDAVFANGAGTLNTFLHSTDTYQFLASRVYLVEAIVTTTRLDVGLRTNAGSGLNISWGIELSAVAASGIRMNGASIANVIHPTMASSVRRQIAIRRLTSGGIALYVGGELVWVEKGLLATDDLLVRVGQAVSGNAGKAGYFRIRDLGTAFADIAPDLSYTPSGQNLGAELLTNGDFSAWTGAHAPTGWTVNQGVGPPDPELTEVAAANLHGGGGNGAANFYASSGVAARPSATQASRTVGSIYQAEVEVSAYGSGIALVNLAVITSSGANTKRFLQRAANVNYILQPNTIGDFTINTASDKLVTRNTAQTMPSADVIAIAAFTVPASPVAGDEYHLLTRIAAAGEEFLNCDDTYLRRNDANTSYDQRLDSIVAGTRTNRVNAPATGSTFTDIRIHCSGQARSIFAANGTSVGGRGTATYSANDTATGCNVICTSGWTVGAVTMYKRNDPVIQAELARV